MYLLLLQLTRRAINHASDLRIVVQFGKELRRLLIVADLRELESNCASTERLPVKRALLALSVRIADRLLQRIRLLSCWLAVRDTDDENRLAELVAAHLRDNERVEDLLPELRAERRETLVTLGAHDLLNLLIGPDVAELRRVDLLVVHEADLDAVLVEERGSEDDSLQNKLKILDALAVLLKGHGAAVVDVDDHIVESESDNIIRDLFLDVPCLT